MGLEDTTGRTIQDAYREALARYGALPDITGIDIGPKYTGGVNTETPSIRIHVLRKRALQTLPPANVFPPTIGGFPVDVLERKFAPTGLARVSPQTRPGSGRFTPIVPGISVSHELCPAGTLGLVVRDNHTGKRALLSNWHIFADSSFAKKGDPITQPSSMDGGVAPRDTVATLGRTFLDKDGDAGIAFLTPTRPCDLRIRDLGVTATAIDDPRDGDIVVKCGRTTDVTKGRVEGRGTYFLFYQTVDRIGIECFKIVALESGNPHNTELSAPGDSGAVWLREGTSTVLGLQLAGETDPAPNKEEALACFATRVFRRLSISLVKET